MPQSSAEILESIQNYSDKPAKLLAYLNTLEAPLPREISTLVFRLPSAIFPNAYTNGNILHYLVLSKRKDVLGFSWELVLALLAKLDSDTMDILMNKPWDGLKTACEYMIMPRLEDPEHQDFFCQFILLLNQKALINLISDAYLLTAVPKDWYEYIIERLEADFLVEMIREIGWGELNQNLEQNNKAANLIIKKILDSSHMGALVLREELLCFLDEENLNVYLALRPEEKQRAQKKLGIKSQFSNGETWADFEKKADRATFKINERVRLINEYFKSITLPTVIVDIILDYAVEISRSLKIKKKLASHGKNSDELIRRRSVLKWVAQYFPWPAPEKPHKIGISRYSPLVEVSNYLFGESEVSDFSVLEFNRSSWAIQEIREADQKTFMPLYRGMESLSIQDNQSNASKNLMERKKELEVFSNSKEMGSEYNEEHRFTLFCLNKKVIEANQFYQIERFEKMIGKWIEKESSLFFKVSQEAELIAQANRYGYQCKNVSEDGNCFFHAILDQLQYKGLSYLGETVFLLRACAMDYFIKNLSEFQDFLDEHDQDLNAFVDKNSQNKTWADHLIIMALSKALNVTIVIISSDGADPTVVKRQDPMGVLYLGYEVGQHYQSLIPDPSLAVTAEISLEERIGRKTALRR